MSDFEDWVYIYKLQTFTAPQMIIRVTINHHRATHTKQLRACGMITAFSTWLIPKKVVDILSSLPPRIIELEPFTDSKKLHVCSFRPTACGW